MAEERIRVQLVDRPDYYAEMTRAEAEAYHAHTQAEGTGVQTEALPISPAAERALREAGYETRAQLDAASDEELLAIQGVGEATLRAIRGAREVAVAEAAEAEAEASEAGEPE